MMKILDKCLNSLDLCNIIIKRHWEAELDNKLFKLLFNTNEDVVEYNEDSL